MTKTESTAKSKVKVRRAHCSRCGGIRNCRIQGEYSETYKNENFQSWTDWYILVCRGCDNTFVQKVDTNSEEYENSYASDGSTEIELIESVHYWPALLKRKKPDWISSYAIASDHMYNLNEALLELYGALENDLYMLAAIGIRTAFDVGSELLDIAPSLPFKQKLDAIVALGGFGTVDKDRMETIVDAGSASVHRGWRPTVAEINTMMDVLEHFIQKLFIEPARETKLNAAAAKVKSSVPARLPRSKRVLPPK